MTGVVTAAVALTVGTAYNIYAGEKAAKLQEKQLEMQRQSQAESLSRQKKADKLSEEATNKAMSKSPDSAAALAGAEQSAMVGDMGTMLTGPGGIDLASLNLGRKTLLGG
jgi:hypothetical protein